MMTFDKSIIKSYKQGLISEETAMAYASRKDITGRGIDMIKSTRGEKTTDIEGLSLDGDYSKKTGRFRR